MSKIKLVPSGRTYEYSEGETLLNILVSEKIFVDNPCNGKGTCGKCKVKILSGSCAPLTETERKYIKEDEAAAGVRLSCLVFPEGDLEIELLQKERAHRVLTTGYMPDFRKDPDITKKTVSICRPSLKDQTSFEDQLKNQLADTDVSFEVLKDLYFEEGIYTAVIHEDANGRKTVTDIERGDTAGVMFGAAIDIGTTTVVTSLIDMNTGEEAASSSRINAQKHFGLDVLTRITYELENRDEGIQKLQTVIVDSINEMIEDTCSQAGIHKENIYGIAVSANCTMMHMLLGIDATAIGKAPYAPVFVCSKDIPALSIGLKAARGARLYCLPSVSAFIGADIVAGAYVCELQKSKENILFIDIGTNGEIVFSDRGKLISCSCAAGPALEGMNISSGMRAANGAVEDVLITKEGVKLKVIGDAEPVGICGSGILAVVKELVKHGLVTKRGVFQKPENLPENDFRLAMLRTNGQKREFILVSGPEELLITQRDIRQVQLAKGAVLSGFFALLKKAGKSIEELDKVMVAGQFGAHLPAESLIGAGILPEAVKDRLVYVGNTSKTGAYMALLSKTVKRELEELARRMDYMELSAAEGYERLFADCLMFPDI